MKTMPRKAAFECGVFREWFRRGQEACMNIELTEGQKIKLMNSSMVYKVMKQILLREDEIERDHEHFWIICLAANNKILNIELVSLGAVDETIVKPMQVFRIAILKGAVKVIMIHNHPTGELKPTPQDMDITDRMIQVGLIVNVQVNDHLIISTERFYSFDDHGLMEKLRLSKKWVPRYKEEERIRNEALKIGEQKGKKRGLKEGANKEKIKMAKKMKKEGEPIKKISRYTGLSGLEIESL
jgi:DNA repair protein RadC